MNKRALIVGGGIAGMSCAIALGQIGWSTELIDIDPAWRPLGAGLTLGGPTLRAFKALGLWEEVAARGFLSRQLTMIRRDGTVVGQAPIPECESGVAGLGGILRPVLHGILANHVRKAGSIVRLGVSVVELSDTGSVVRVVFSDGKTGEYDLVIGADSLNSSLRNMLFGTTHVPRFTGQGCWRLLAPKPVDQQGLVVCVEGPGVGFNPVSETHMYMFTTVDDPEKRIIPQDEQLERLRAVLAGYGGLVADIHDHMDSSYMVNYRPLEYLFIDGPWHRGRVLLIGDAAHATTPQLGHGAGLAVEDAVVLREELSKSDDLHEVFDRFMARRFERARHVVETSVKIGELELARRWEERSALHISGSARLLEPI